jgi:hypothetical protein
VVTQDSIGVSWTEFYLLRRLLFLYERLIIPQLSLQDVFVSLMIAKVANLLIEHTLMTEESIILKVIVTHCTLDLNFRCLKFHLLVCNWINLFGFLHRYFVILDHLSIFLRIKEIK